MYTKNKTLLLSVIILSVFCINMVCWGQGIIVFSLGGDTYMMHPDDVEPRKISEMRTAGPSPDGRFLAERSKYRTKRYPQHPASTYRQENPLP